MTTTQDESFRYALVVAYDLRRAIGNKQRLPWPDLPADRARFRQLTVDGVVVMGRKTYESLPASARPLRKRINIVVSSRGATLCSADKGDVFFAATLAEALVLASTFARPTFVIGGTRLFAEALVDPRCDQIYLTQIIARFEADTFFPAFDTSEWAWKQQEEQEESRVVPFTFYTLTRRC